MAYSAIQFEANDPTGLTVSYIVRKMLDSLRNKLRFAPLATKTEIPVNFGSYVARWVLPADVPVDTTPLTSFATATNQNAIADQTWKTYEGTCLNYGQQGRFAQMQDKSWLPQAKNHISDSFSYAALATLDTLLRNEADDTTTYICAGNVNSGEGTLATTDTMTAQDVVAVGGFFDEGNCMGFDHLGDDYCLIIHGRAAKQMQSHINQPGATSGAVLSWVETQARQLPGYRKLERYELGTYAGVSVQVSNNIGTASLTTGTTPATASGSITAYKNIGISKGAIGRANLGMENFTLRMIPADRIDKTDPLGLYGILGWYWRGAVNDLDVNNRAVILYTAP